VTSQDTTESTHTPFSSSTCSDIQTSKGAASFYNTTNSRNFHFPAFEMCLTDKVTFDCEHVEYRLHPRCHYKRKELRYRNKEDPFRSDERKITKNMNKCLDQTREVRVRARGELCEDCQAHADQVAAEREAQLAADREAANASPRIYAAIPDPVCKLSLRCLFVASSNQILR
jgi:hypothetical protein